MSLYALTPLARADIFDIWSYIAADNEPVADVVERAIYEACSFIAEAPERGHRRPGLTSRPMRFWTLGFGRSRHIPTTPSSIGQKRRQCKL